MLKIYSSFLFYLLYFWVSSLVFPVKIIASDDLLQLVAIWEDIEGQHDERDFSSIDVDPLGFIYLSDVHNNTILKLNTQGKVVCEVGGFGWEADQFDHPAGVSALNGLDVFIADYMNHRIVRYDNKLNYISASANNIDWEEELQFGFPKDVQISQQGELFLIDGENQRILKFDVLGDPQISFGDFDENDGNLVQPEKFVIDHDLIYVTDSNLAKVFIFDIHGNYISSFSFKEMKIPTGLAVYHNYLFVSDRESECIWIFSKRGELLKKISSASTGCVALNHPEDLAFYQEYLYVLNKNTAQILVFKYLGFKGD